MDDDRRNSGEGRRVLARSEAEGAVPPPRPAWPIPELLSACLVVLDKPAGVTSRKASDMVARALGAVRTGHAGTLDPAVTGVLPVAAGEATKVLGVLLSAGKEYVGTLRLHGDPSDEALNAARKAFTGSIVQTPPVRSRVRRRPRTRRVYAFEFLERAGRDVRFRAGVEAGTYIRKLVHDLGEALGCGAHMTVLRRTRAGPFTESQAVDPGTLRCARSRAEDGQEEMLRALLRPPEEAVEHLGKVWMVEGAVDRIRGGSPLYAPGVAFCETGIRPSDTVALLSDRGELVALGQARVGSEELVAMERGEAVAVKRVVRTRREGD
jgi:H/ACA ribonucleoprotein complex subunit 4